MDEHEMLKRLAAPLAFTGLISSVASISLMLRNQEVVKTKDIVAAIGTSFTAATILFLLLRSYLEEQPYLLYGVSILAGAGGASTFDLLFFLARRWARKKGFMPSQLPFTDNNSATDEE